MQIDRASLAYQARAFYIQNKGAETIKADEISLFDDKTKQTKEFKDAAADGKISLEEFMKLSEPTIAIEQISIKDKQIINFIKDCFQKRNLQHCYDILVDYDMDTIIGNTADKDVDSLITNLNTKFDQLEKIYTLLDPLLHQGNLKPTKDNAPAFMNQAKTVDAQINEIQRNVSRCFYEATKGENINPEDFIKSLHNLEKFIKDFDVQTFADLSSTKNFIDMLCGNTNNAQQVRDIILPFLADQSISKQDMPIGSLIDMCTTAINNNRPDQAKDITSIFKLLANNKVLNTNELRFITRDPSLLKKLLTKSPEKLTTILNNYAFIAQNINTDFAQSLLSISNTTLLEDKNLEQNDLYKTILKLKEYVPSWSVGVNLYTIGIDISTSQPVSQAKKLENLNEILKFLPKLDSFANRSFNQTIISRIDLEKPIAPQIQMFLDISKNLSETELIDLTSAIGNLTREDMAMLNDIKPGNRALITKTIIQETANGNSLYQPISTDNNISIIGYFATLDKALSPEEITKLTPILANCNNFGISAEDIIKFFAITDRQTRNMYLDYGMNKETAGLYKGWLIQLSIANLTKGLASKDPRDMNAIGNPIYGNSPDQDTLDAFTNYLKQKGLPEKLVNDIIFTCINYGMFAYTLLSDESCLNKIVSAIDKAEPPTISSVFSLILINIMDSGEKLFSDQYFTTAEMKNTFSDMLPNILDHALGNISDTNLIGTKKQSSESNKVLLDYRENYAKVTAINTTIILATSDEETIQRIKALRESYDKAYLAFTKDPKTAEELDKAYAAYTQEIHALETMQPENQAQAADIIHEGSAHHERAAGYSKSKAEADPAKAIEIIEEANTITQNIIQNISATPIAQNSPEIKEALDKYKVTAEKTYKATLAFINFIIEQKQATNKAEKTTAIPLQTNTKPNYKKLQDQTTITNYLDFIKYILKNNVNNAKQELIELLNKARKDSIKEITSGQILEFLKRIGISADDISPAMIAQIRAKIMQPFHRLQAAKISKR